MRYMYTLIRVSQVHKKANRTTHTPTMMPKTNNTLTMIRRYFHHGHLPILFARVESINLGSGSRRQATEPLQALHLSRRDGVTGDMLSSLDVLDECQLEVPFSSSSKFLAAGMLALLSEPMVPRGI